MCLPSPCLMLPMAAQFLRIVRSVSHSPCVTGPGTMIDCPDLRSLMFHLIIRPKPCLRRAPLYKVDVIFSPVGMSLLGWSALGHFISCTVPYDSAQVILGEPLSVAPNWRNAGGFARHLQLSSLCQSQLAGFSRPNILTAIPLTFCFHRQGYDDT